MIHQGAPSRGVAFHLRFHVERLADLELPHHRGAAERRGRERHRLPSRGRPAVPARRGGGLGLGRNEVSFDPGFGVGDTGFAGLLGAGWEIRVARRLYLNPALDLVEHRYTGRGGDRYRERLVNFGVGVLFQSGR